MEKRNITILWLDDVREPNNYFNKPRTSGAWTRNNDFYQNILTNYNVNFIWVKNLKEFQNYILNNPMPDMISFDHDLKPKGHVGEFENGVDCLNWLVKYCKENGLNFPKCYAHTANNKQRPLFTDIFNTNNISNKLNENSNKMKKFFITESDIRKMVSSAVNKLLKENFDQSSDIVNKVVNYIMEIEGDNIDDMTTFSEVYNIVQDAYIDITGTELTDDNMKRAIIQTLSRRIFGR